MAEVDLQAVHDTLVSVAFEAGRMILAANPNKISTDTKLNGSSPFTPTPPSPSTPKPSNPNQSNPPQKKKKTKPLANPSPLSPPPQQLSTS